MTNHDAFHGNCEKVKDRLQARSLLAPRPKNRTISRFTVSHHRAQSLIFVTAGMCRSFKGQFCTITRAQSSVTGSFPCPVPRGAQIPGVAVNRSRDAKKADPICSPPPAHQPFRLPDTYMHHGGAKPRFDAASTSGDGRPHAPALRLRRDDDEPRWHHANQEQRVGVGGATTRVFHTCRVSERAS